MSLNETLIFGLIMMVAGALGGWRASCRANYDAGYTRGHTQGVLDATPWDCGCGCRNPPNTMMCAFCGADREFLSESLHSKEKT